ncbi:MAG: hypothetical protein H6622_08150 [Halobacteriovoraceae bacterium]|nr:hypothetical protein [Halobacteriovoraceae bacterium]
MYSSTGYEALYLYLGLNLQKGLRDILVSESFFQAIVLLTIGCIFFFTTFKFFSKYLPGVLVYRASVPLSKFFWIFVSIFLGISVLKVGSDSFVKNYEGESWHKNPYVASRGVSIDERVEVSALFDILSRSANEFSALLSHLVDKLMTKSHSQLKAPSFFYKSIMYAGATTIDDPDLREEINFYTKECVEKVLPLVETQDRRLDFISGFFKQNQTELDNALSEIKIEGRDGGDFGTSLDCLELKQNVSNSFHSYVDNTTDGWGDTFRDYYIKNFSEEQFKNISYSSALLNHYLDEDWFGINKGSQVPGGAAKWFQYLNKIFTWDGFLSITGSLLGFDGDGIHGSALAAKRSEEFNQLLSRAPHVKGFITLLLVALFPLLIFPVVAGKWKWIVFWFLTYFSVLLWEPIWTLFYHIVTNLAIAGETLEYLGELNSGAHLYYSKVVTSRIYYMYSVYSWLQVLIGPFFTGCMLMSFRGLLKDKEEESAPQFVGETKSTAIKTLSPMKGAE